VGAEAGAAVEVDVEVSGIAGQEAAETGETPNAREDDRGLAAWVEVDPDGEERVFEPGDAGEDEQEEERGRRFPSETVKKVIIVLYLTRMPSYSLSF
jgi:hypothetical protein